MLRVQKRARPEFPELDVHSLFMDGMNGKCRSTEVDDTFSDNGFNLSMLLMVHDHGMTKATPKTKQRIEGR